MRTLDWICLILVILGALNWGIVSITNFNMFGTDGNLSGLTRFFYGIVGLAAIYLIISAANRRDILVDYYPPSVRKTEV
jgi:uncharacterized membrane protein YuzA (DUF378 family)